MTGRINLYAAEKRRGFAVVSAPGISLLESLGIRAGTRVSVQHRYAFGGPVLMRVEDAYTVALGKDVAEQIEVAGLAAEQINAAGNRAAV